MVSISLFTAKAFTILAYALTVQAAALPTRQDKGPGFIRFPLKAADKPTNGTILAVDSSVVPLDDEWASKGSYYIDLLFGSQAQSISVVLDTGSSDLWVADSNSVSGGFDNSASSTYQDTGVPFSIEYVSGDASGEWATDTVGIPNGPSLSNFQFADISTPNPIGSGILGVGYAAGEATNSQYPNFPRALKDDGYISKVAYSLYLNKIGAPEGEIIFGGIDNAKYSGGLTYLPVQNPSGGALDVSFDSITFPDGTVYSVDTTAVLDSGTSLTYIPNDAYAALQKSLGWPSIQGLIQVPNCQVPSGEFEFTFGGKSIKIPWQEIVAQIDSNGDCAILLAPVSQSRGYVLIGDVILRSMYVVYDLEDNKIGIAQVKYTSDSNVVPIS